MLQVLQAGMPGTYRAACLCTLLQLCKFEDFSAGYSSFFGFGAFPCPVPRGDVDGAVNIREQPQASSSVTGGCGGRLRSVNGLQVLQGSV